MTEEAAMVAAWLRQAAWLRKRPEEASQLEKEMMDDMACKEARSKIGRGTEG